MRIALITFKKEKNATFNKIVKDMVESAQKNGHDVQVFDGYEDLTNTRLTVFEYITVVYQSSSFFSGKLPERIKDYFSASGSILGKKVSSFVVKKGFRSLKESQNLMKILESQGVVIDYFDVLTSAAQASYAGKKIG